MTTYSPTFTLSTPSPTSTTWPMFSWPNQRPVSKSVRPSYMCRSDPQMFVVVMRTSTSVGRSMRASGTSFTLTWRGPSYTTAFTLSSWFLDLSLEPPATSGTPDTAGSFHPTSDGRVSPSAELPISELVPSAIARVEGPGSGSHRWELSALSRPGPWHPD